MNSSFIVDLQLSTLSIYFIIYFSVLPKANELTYLEVHLTWHFKAKKIHA